MAKRKRSGGGPEKAVRGVDLTEVERLLAFMQKHRLEQFEYEAGGIHIMLKKASAHSPADLRLVRGTEALRDESAEQPDAARDSGAERTEKPAAAKAADDLHVVKSPIVGTFYAAASPDADPFVRLKAGVEQGQVLCIIEAMKLMNEIESDVAGEVVKIFVENGHPVEYGQPLFGIRPRRKR
jgi:acetyl-CoA carboxylase biotin carboxyl carrier protein